MVFYIAERSPEKRRGMAAGLNGKGKSGMRGKKRIALCAACMVGMAAFAACGVKNEVVNYQMCIRDRRGRAALRGAERPESKRSRNHLYLA